VLELVAVDTVLERPDGEPWDVELVHLPGGLYYPLGATPADPPGFAVGHYLYSRLGPDEPRFPVNEEFTALNLRFRIQPEARPRPRKSSSSR